MAAVKSKTKKVAVKEKTVKKEPAGLGSEKKELNPPHPSFKKEGTGLELPVYNTEGKEVSKIELNSQIFGLKLNPDLVKQAVEAQMSQSRIPYAHVKDRSEVRGGGKKPWRQKGTGRARHGSIRSPIWRGGGVTFGPRKEKVFAKKINKKMRRRALFMVLSGKAHDNELIILDDLKLGQPKTKLIAKVLKNIFGVFAGVAERNSALSRSSASLLQDKSLAKARTPSVLIALPVSDKNVILAVRNIPKSSTIGASSLNVIDLLSHKYLIMPKESLGVIEKTFKNHE